MANDTRGEQFPILLSLLVLTSVTGFAHWAYHAHQANEVKHTSYPAAATVVAPHPMEPAQSGGSYNITQSVIAGGGGASSGGSYAETGVIGQSVVGASSGGQYSVEGGFVVSGQSGGCQTILVGPSTLPNGTVSVSYPTQMFSASGGTAPYSFSVSIGNLPTGLNLVGNTLSGTPTAAGTFNFTITATDNFGCSGFQTYAVTISTISSGLQFYPLAHPVRLLDTRLGATGCDTPGAQIPGNTSRTQAAAGRTCDGLTIPANAKALTGNITTVESGGGFLTLYPSDVTRPLVANSNFAANQVLNNVFTVGLGAGDGAFNIYVTTNTNVVVDITGYYAPPSASGLYFHPLPHPVRLMDSRAGATACFTPGAQLAAGSTTTQLGTTTCDGVLIPAGTLALVGNATTVNPQANGFLTLFPADATRPLVASSNFQTGINMNAPFTVGLSPSGQFNIYTAATTDLVVDVLGYFSTQLNDTNGQGLLFNPLPTPVRLLDTRAGQTGCFTPGAQMIGGTAYLQPATGVCTGIPAAAKAVVGNATTVNVSANGFLTFWPSDATQPFIATSNYRTGIVFNRHFTVGLGADGAFKRYAASTTDLVIDLSGYFAP
ncbi:MAG: putative Ig domain-containing protein [Acidobacteria bacterium]|nr:putative Ig domain-containing protein [Acidobacteriota bacterium]